jgi:hypothetical protein
MTALVSLVIGAPGAVRADEGMWLLNKPPAELLQETYGFEPTAAFLENLQGSAVRMGASGSMVSADGLLMTNHHVATSALQKLSTNERDLLKDGFIARTRADELKVPDMEVSVLMSIADVTDQVNAAAKDGMSAADANTARRKAMTAIEQAAKEKTGLLAQTVTLYNGGKYHLYSYKKFDDVRLVFAPEAQIGFFGGDADNFEFPRFCLDVAFFRVYENGKPVHNKHFLRWSPAGAGDGELTFVVGHPGHTRRLDTVDHLKYFRDVSIPTSLERLWRAEVKTQTFMGRSAEHHRVAKKDLFGIANSRKVSTGRYAGLLDPAIMNSKTASENALKAAVEANPEWRRKWGDAWNLIATAQQNARGMFTRQSGLGSMGGGSDVFGFASTLVRLADELPKPSQDRLREYRDTALPSLYSSLYTDEPLYPFYEAAKLENGLLAMAETLGGDDPAVLTALAGKTPRARAEELVSGTKLFDVAERKRLAEGGKKAIDESNDPLIAMFKHVDPELRSLRTKAEDTVEALEREGYSKIAAAKFAIDGDSVYPDATGTLRLAFGPVKGYEEAGTAIPAFTTIAGLFARAEDREGEKEFALPESWIRARDSLDMSTPLNLVSTADIIGGNSGSPLVNGRGEVVGIIFDGNLHSLATDIAYDAKMSRAISVDSRGIIEALRKVYDAGFLADEIQGAKSATPAAP